MQDQDEDTGVHGFCGAGECAADIEERGLVQSAVWLYQERKLYTVFYESRKVLAPCSFIVQAILNGLLHAAGHKLNSSQNSFIG